MTRHSPTADVGVAAIAKIVAQLGWIFRSQGGPDIGIDALVEIAEPKLAGLLALQIKSGESWFKERSSDSIVYRDSNVHLDYWLNYPLPVVVVLYEPDSDRAYWQEVNHRTVIRTELAWKMDVPVDNVLGGLTADRLARIARPELERLGSLKSYFPNLTGPSPTLRLVTLNEGFARARAYIHVASFRISRQMFAALQMRAEAVSVRLLIGGQSADALSADIGDLATDAPRRIDIRTLEGLHIKFFVIDGVVAIVTSAPFDERSILNEDEVFLPSSDVHEIAVVEQQFADIWIKGVPL